jgi:hypothetical protein
VLLDGSDGPGNTFVLYRKEAHNRQKQQTGVQMPLAVRLSKAMDIAAGGFLDVAALCWAANLPLSSHCGPSMHLHVCCSVPRSIHMEFFHDHARIERMFFDGFCEPQNGIMKPNLNRPGNGLELKEKDAAAYRL